MTEYFSPSRVAFAASDAQPQESRRRRSEDSAKCDAGAAVFLFKSTRATVVQCGAFSDVQSS